MAISQINFNSTSLSSAPAFLVYPNSDQSNMANDETLVFDLEYFDQNTNFASNTFTAPVTGKYLMCVAARIDAVDENASWVRIEMVTSNRSYSPSLVDPGGLGTNDFMSIDFSIIVDMDANDTAVVQAYQVGGTAQTDIVSASTFSGYLVA